MTKYSVLMVCLGNICRSPMADGLLRKKVKDENLPVFVDSAGTGNWHVGNPPDERMRKTAHSNDCPIDDLRARQFQAEDFVNFDYIYVMDKENYKNVVQLATSEKDKHKVKLILNEIHPGKDLEVPDPYFGGEQGFKEVFSLLDQATDQIITNLKKAISNE